MTDDDTNLFGEPLPRLGAPLFAERWDNRKCARIGYMAGQGLSAPAIERALGENGTANTIAHMLNVWGIRLPQGKHTHGPVKVMLSARHRTMLAAEAMSRETDLPELCRRILVQVASDDLYAAVLEG